jgi:hypothetical protein
MTTNLLALRTPDGRLSYASYKDEQEKARILAWAQRNAAQVETSPPATRTQVSNLLA